MRRASGLLLFFLLFFSVLPSAAPLPKDGTAAAVPGDRPLVFIILPIENVSVMYEKFLPLKEYLEKKLSRKIALKVARNYQDAIDSIGDGRADLAFLDPSAYCEARRKYRVLPVARAILNGAPTYRSVIVTRSDSPVKKIIDVKGKRLALGNLYSSSSYLIPAVIFKEVGIELKDFRSVDYLEQENRIALSVLSRKHDVGGLSEHVAAKYTGDGLRVIKTSEAIPQFTVCASPGLAGDLRDSVMSALVEVSSEKTPELTAAMKDISGFSAAKDRDYDVVRVMLKNLSGKNYLEYGKNTIKVVILPLYSAITLFDRFDPLMRYLSQKTGYEFKLMIPKDFEDFSDSVKKGKADFSYSNPYIYIELAEKGFLKAFANTVHSEDGDNFRGVIITRSDSPLRSLEDLRGKKVMVVSYKSAGGFLVQKLYLQEQKLDVFRDLKLVEGKRQEEVILNVYRKTVDAGFVRESALEVLKEEIDMGSIRVLARTPYISNWPFAALRNADPRLTKKVQKSLVELDEAAVLSAAHIRNFKPARDGDYDNLRAWIHRHETD